MTRAASGTIGVGLLGAGPVVQAIHIPTLARLTDLYTVTHVMDVAANVAERVATRTGASWSTTVDELLADDAVEVVAVCSPHTFHASQAVAAMRSGKRAVLCEKPFATTRGEAEEIAKVSAETGVPVIVGAMHTFDAAWTGPAREWGDLPQTAHTIRSSIVIPPNPRFEDWATEIPDRPAPPGPRTPGPDDAAMMMIGAVMGLAIHDLPLVRTFTGTAEPKVTAARTIAPFGYAIAIEADGRLVELSGLAHDHWKTRWEFDAIADDQSLHIDFTPSYVQAGSGTSTLRRADGVRLVFGERDENGYEGEWRALHALLGGDAAAAPSLQSLIDDLDYALSIADQASTLVRKESRR